MKASHLFILLIGTSFSVVMWCTLIPELCAVGTFTGIICFIGWTKFIEQVSRW